MSSFATDPERTTTVLRHVPDHAELARLGLTVPLREKPRAAAMAQALGAAAQGFEDTMHAQLTGATLANAVGADLDDWGAIVDEPRGVLLADDQYRLFVQAAVLANRCDGTPDKLLEVFSLITAPHLVVDYLPMLPAGFVLQVVRLEWMTEPVRRRVRRLMDRIQPAGRTMVLTEGIAGAWAPEGYPYAAAPGYISRSI